MTKTIEKIINDYNNGVYTPKDTGKKIPAKYPTGYIFDEEQSVRWNREELERQNRLIDDEWQILIAEENRLGAMLRDDVRQFISDDLLSKDDYPENKSYFETAKDIEEILFDEYHGNMFEYLDKVTSVLRYVYVALGFNRKYWW